MLFENFRVWIEWCANINLTESFQDIAFQIGEYHHLLGNPIPYHDIRKNWGSSTLTTAQLPSVPTTVELIFFPPEI
jgi:hypothetical protein